MTDIERQLEKASIGECVRVIELAHARLERWKADVAEAQERALGVLQPSRRKQRVQLASGVSAPAGDLDGDEEAVQ